MLRPHPTHNIIPPIKMIKKRMVAQFRLGLAPNRNMPNNPKPVVSVHTANTVRGAVPGTESCAPVPVVLTLTVIAAGSAPGVTEVGLMVHVENAGTPSQTRLTALEKVPPTGVIDMV